MTTQESIMSELTVGAKTTRELAALIKLPHFVVRSALSGLHRQKRIAVVGKRPSIGHGPSIVSVWGLP